MGNENVLMGTECLTLCVQVPPAYPAISGVHHDVKKIYKNIKQAYLDAAQLRSILITIDVNSIPT